MTATEKKSDRFRDSGRDLTETDLAADKMGRNSLQGDDQSKVRNQRQSVPDAKKDAEDVVESFENMDPETRARREQEKARRGG